MLSTRSHVVDHGFPHDVSMTDGLSALKIYREQENKTAVLIFSVLKEAFKWTTWQAFLSKKRRRAGRALSALMESWPPLTVKLLQGASPHGLRVK